MTTLIPYPGLTSQGWTNTPTVVADKLLSDFFLSDYSQTYAFPQKVASFAKLIQLHRGDLTALVNDTTSTLRSYLQKFFSEVILTIDYKSTDGSDNTYALEIYLELIDSIGQKVLLGRMLEVENNIITGLMAILREG